MNWAAATRDASGATSPFTKPKQMRFDTLGGAQFSRADSIVEPTGAFKQLNDALCGQDSHPVVVGVAGLKPNSCEPTSGLPVGATPGHFVLVTGRTIDSNGVPHYSIADPGCAANTSLDAYDNNFVTRGVVKDPPGDISELVVV